MLTDTFNVKLSGMQMEILNYLKQDLYLRDSGSMLQILLPWEALAVPDKSSSLIMISL